MNRHRAQAIGAAIVTGILLLFFLSLPGTETFHKKGPFNPGHNSLVCADCHVKAQGTLRQQLQAKARYLLGQRSQNVAIGSDDIDNQTCLRCHTRSDDRHPVFRFTEPRFKAAREAIAPHQCESCHREHSNQRLVVQEGFCSNCHQDLKLEVDPLEISHSQLIEKKMWTVCLQCHDFHGNHLTRLPGSLNDTIPHEVIREYFYQGKSPYGELKKNEAAKIIAFIEKL